MQNAQSRPVAQALINGNQIHFSATRHRRATATGIGSLFVRSFLGKTLCSFATELDVDVPASWVHVSDGILRYDATVILDFNIELTVGQHPMAEAQDFGEAIGRQAMVSVVADVCLHHDRFRCPDNAAAINKPFCDMTDFGDMRVRRNVITLWQYKPWQ